LGLSILYPLGMLVPAFTVYQWLLHRYGSEKLKERMKLDEVSGF
jgi:hypothetical protein